MIIYNLTDIAPSFDKGRRAAPVKVMGRVIEPGKSIELPDGMKIRCPGLIQQGRISVDSIPPWYEKSRAKLQKAATAKVSPTLDKRVKSAPIVDEDKPKPIPRSEVVEEE